MLGRELFAFVHKLYDEVHIASDVLQLFLYCFTDLPGRTFLAPGDVQVIATRKFSVCAWLISVLDAADLIYH